MNWQPIPTIAFLLLGCRHYPLATSHWWDIYGCTCTCCGCARTYSSVFITLYQIFMKLYVHMLGTKLKEDARVPYPPTHTCIPIDDLSRKDNEGALSSECVGSTESESNSPNGQRHAQVILFRILRNVDQKQVGGQHGGMDMFTKWKVILWTGRLIRNACWPPIYLLVQYLFHISDLSTGRPIFWSSTGTSRICLLWDRVWASSSGNVLSHISDPSTFRTSARPAVFQ